MSSAPSLTETLLGDPARMISTDNVRLMGNSKVEADLEPSSAWVMSNQLVLQVTCASFLVFVLGEVAGAIIGNSWSLLGDAAAMSVDVMTYFTNMQAERIKSRCGFVPLGTKMILEVYVPTFSVLCLLGVTAYVTVGSVHDILYKPEDDVVDIGVMYGFAIGNAIVDVLSIYMFWSKGNSVFKQEVHALASSDALEEGVGEGDDADGVMVGSGPPETVVTGTEKNLNMISAFTHVGGDTLRTLSIFIAAVVATAGGGAGYLCDAWAASVVTLTIVIMVIPLSRDIARAYWKISAQMEEESN